MNRTTHKAAKLAMLALGLSAAAMGLDSCGNKPKGYYELPVDEVLDRLRNADIIGFRNARQCGYLIHFTVHEELHRSIGWTVKSSGEEVASFTIHAAAQGAGTQTTIDVPNGPDGTELYNGNATYPRPVLMQPLRPAVQELIDSAIEKRPYDWHRIPDPLNTDALCGSMRDNLESGGASYNINDPPGMTHSQAEDWRNR